jgi:hypothetical protein
MFKTVSPLSRNAIHVPRIAHALHNCVKSSLSRATELQALRDKCHSLATFFHASPKMVQKQYEEQLQDYDQTPLGVIVDVVTRWNSTFHMLQRLVYLRSYIDTVPMHMEDKDAIRLRDVTPTHEEWE